MSKDASMTLRAAIVLSALLAAGAARADIVVKRVTADVATADPSAKYWQGVSESTVVLMAQPMVVPRPALVQTSAVTVQAVHDGKRIAFRLRWKDTERNEAGRLGEFSDAAAVQFPLKPGDVPPPVMMGMKGNPVHIFHWRAQYQRDRERGKPTMRDLYPNLSIDMYPLEFKDAQGATETERDRFSPGRAEGNPQSYAKTGVDEIVAEGFSTSSVQSGHGGTATGAWKNGEWTLVLVRPLAVEGGSTLKEGGKGFAAFAVWQGGKSEVGSRKSVTMTWTPVVVSK